MGEPFYSLNQYLQEQYGEKVYKLALNGGMTCPNRDGTLGTRGCLFCSAGGSGEFAVPVCLKGNTEAVPPHSVEQQIEAAKQRLSGKRVGNKFIAYFQAYTNTYAPVEYLRALYLPVLMREDIVGLSIATRPDCLPEDVLDLLEELNQIKPVWVELGLQTIHEETARYIRRGYELSCFEQAVAELGKRNLEVIVHLIFGLPGESKEDMLASVRYLNEVGSTHSLLQEQEAYGKIKELFSIQVVEPYPADWDECLSRANQEKADGTRPELVQNVEDMEEYDVIFLGYPNWWYSCPMALLSFIESNDFSGKQIYLFCSHGTGGLARSVQDITAVLPDGNISENVFDAYEEDTAGSREDVREWLKEIH